MHVLGICFLAVVQTLELHQCVKQRIIETIVPRVRVRGNFKGMTSKITQRVSTPTDGMYCFQQLCGVTLPRCKGLDIVMYKRWICDIPSILEAPRCGGKSQAHTVKRNNSANSGQFISIVPIPKSVLIISLDN